MCTVTYIPASNGQGFVLTSNRDEKVYRPCFPPVVFENNGIKMLYPKDSKAGGSWIAANSRQRVCCLLNGAFEPHKKQAYHSISRGKVLTELAASEKEPVSYMEDRDLSNVEPFTIILLDQEQGEISSFIEIIWDGKEKHFRKLNEQDTYIWSSVTLYSDEQRELRRKWFRRFLQTNIEYITPENIFSFHSGKHISDDTVNIVMEREGGLKTVSITQVFPLKGKIQMKYKDLIFGINSKIEL